MSTLGIVYYRMHRYDDAISYLTQAIQIEPKNAAAHNYLGITSSQKGWPEEALEELTKAVHPESEVRRRAFQPRRRLRDILSPPLSDRAQEHYKIAIALGAAPDPTLEKLLAPAADPPPPEDDGALPPRKRGPDARRMRKHFVLPHVLATVLHTMDETRREASAISLKSFLIELVVYALFVVAYFALVLHFLGGWFKDLSDHHRWEYAARRSGGRAWSGRRAGSHHHGVVAFYPLENRLDRAAWISSSPARTSTRTCS